MRVERGELRVESSEASRAAALATGTSRQDAKAQRRVVVSLFAPWRLCVRPISASPACAASRSCATGYASAAAGKKGTVPICAKHPPGRSGGHRPQVGRGLSPFSRSAFTLVEMLIVVAIMMILVAAAATTLHPANDSRRVREAARAVDLYLASARNRAMETGRPCGVILRRFNDTASVMTMDQCAVPPPYCGDAETSTAIVSAGTGATIGPYIDPKTNISAPTFYEDYTANFNPADFNTALVHVGDLIRFNHQGPAYTIVGPSAHSGMPGEGINALPLQLDAKLNTGQLVPWTAMPSAPVTYSIDRIPGKGSAQPLQLPASTIIDATASGTDGAVFGGDSDAIILFGPNGCVDCVYGYGFKFNVVSPIYLLIGKQERMANAFNPNPPTEADMTNYQDLNNLWVMINPQTGLVTTSEVSAIPIWNNSINYVIGDCVSYNLKLYRCLQNNSNKQPDTSAIEWVETNAAADALRTSRTIARDAQGMGGK